MYRRRGIIGEAMTDISKNVFAASTVAMVIATFDVFSPCNMTIIKICFNNSSIYTIFIFFVTVIILGAIIQIAKNKNNQYDGKYIFGAIYGVIIGTSLSAILAKTQMINISNVTIRFLFVLVISYMTIIFAKYIFSKFYN